MGDTPQVDTLRPKKLDQFIGQDLLRKRLGFSIKAALMSKDPCPHILFEGPPGLGKTTLATIIANEMGATMVTSNGPALTSSDAVTRNLALIGYDGVFFIDEVHATKPAIAETLYEVMEPTLDAEKQRKIITRSHKVTIVASTTKPGKLPDPFLARFGHRLSIDFYSVEELVMILQRAESVLQVDVTLDALEEIARRSQGTPRVAIRLLRQVKDVAQVYGVEQADLALTLEACELQGIDRYGLEEMHRRIITKIGETFGGGPVGAETLAFSLGQDTVSMAEMYEPLLCRGGWIKREPRGRVITEKSVEFFFPEDYKDLTGKEPREEFTE